MMERCKIMLKLHQIVGEVCLRKGRHVDELRQIANVLHCWAKCLDQVRWGARAKQRLGNCKGFIVHLSHPHTHINSTQRITATNTTHTRDGATDIRYIQLFGPQHQIAAQQPHHKDYTKAGWSTQLMIKPEKVTGDNSSHGKGSDGAHRSPWPW